MNHNNACKIILAWRSTLTGKPKVKSGKGYTLQGTSWTPTTTKWNKVMTRLAPKNPDGTVYYRIVCKDALGRKTRGEVRTLRIEQ
jgi:hypothetical protein